MTIPGAPWHHCTRIWPLCSRGSSSSVGQLASGPSTIAVRSSMVGDVARVLDRRAPAGARAGSRRRRGPRRAGAAAAPCRGAASTARARPAGCERTSALSVQASRHRSSPVDACIACATSIDPGAPHMSSFASLCAFSRHAREQPVGELVARCEAIRHGQHSPPRRRTGWWRGSSGAAVQLERAKRGGRRGRSSRPRGREGAARRAPRRHSRGAGVEILERRLAVRQVSLVQRARGRRDRTLPPRSRRSRGRRPERARRPTAPPSAARSRRGERASAGPRAQPDLRPERREQPVGQRLGEVREHVARAVAEEALAVVVEAADLGEAGVLEQALEAAR